ncbi:MAG TPA: GNAT family N-acetyltransferase [Paenibacillus sp.]|uniref:GNAT family N-acetyltransferase n=1 Tax=Paenibacillus sp. TaxID=58172 RepID=UPI002CE0080E|nr:GNAT family N-acetyltransferase [Paenibacillus sp.]HUC92168.1 GNAT family N-acetyltransferase [Paenibacillus sp.]
MGNIELAQVAPDNEELAGLIAKLDAYLLEQYPPDEIFGVDFADPSVNEITFIVAYLDGVPVGCGAIRPLDRDNTELKRFFVDPACRNRGIAKLILDELEARARRSGFRFIKLEAGEKQFEALSFYRKHGYYPIDRFGVYVACETSVCYEKRL